MAEARARDGFCPENGLVPTVQLATDCPIWSWPACAAGAQSGGRGDARYGRTWAHQRLPLCAFPHGRSVNHQLKPEWAGSSGVRKKLGELL